MIYIRIVLSDYSISAGLVSISKFLNTNVIGKLEYSWNFR